MTDDDTRAALTMPANLLMTLAIHLVAPTARLSRETPAAGGIVPISTP